ncbi:cysteine desulfurase family protein [Providencia burhodogranariea]|uniref:cysteine desulfurase n=1 Tax=Providencia burhodogranariea DSM 19968 TaxID=1141662 RepID=K8X3C3_9GAMM|nr:cysteine desulfurase family protein [Providencia burhodogranariea]EKT62945.1 cysteine desulfurase [Providencia burhodogranariea DSM 19968]
MPTIYLDFNASTPIHPLVQKNIQSLLDCVYGNPSSNHWASKNAKSYLNKARKHIAALIGAEPDEIIFTSGGTESNNLALKGRFFSLYNNVAQQHIITQVTEHPSILHPLAFLERLGAKITYLPVDSTGRVNPEDVNNAIISETTLISIMHANNETGTLQPIEEIGLIAKQHNICFHTDAAQSIGKIPVDVNKMNVDLLSIAGHKLYAPKGVGALYIRRGTALEPVNHGAGHEQGIRAGTESILLATALGTACELAKKELYNHNIRSLRDYFWLQLNDTFGDNVVLNGHEIERLPNTLNISFLNHIGANVLAGLDGIAASTGSACHEGQTTISPVLAAMGIDSKIGMGAIRFSLGYGIEKSDIDQVVNQLRCTISDSPTV